MFAVAENVVKLIENSMSQWNTNLTCGNERLGNVNIRRGIFQGDSLSPLEQRIHKLSIVYDLKLFGKNENQLDTMILTVPVFSEDIKMEFAVSKCAVLVMNRGKLINTNGINLPNQECIKALGEEEGYKYLGILEAGSIKKR